MSVLTDLLLAIAVAAFLASFFIEREPKSPVLRKLFRARAAITVLSVGAIYLLLRPGAGVDGRVALQDSVRARQPLVMEFFSNT